MSELALVRFLLAFLFSVSVMVPVIFSLEDNNEPEWKIMRECLT